MHAGLLWWSMRFNLYVLGSAGMLFVTGCTEKPPAVVSTAYFAGTATSSSIISFSDESELPASLIDVDEVPLRRDPVFDSVADVALAPSGLAFVLNGMTGVISAFRHAEPVLMHAAQGQGPGEFVKPERLTWSEDLKRLYVFDSALSAIKILEWRGEERLIEIGLIETPFRVNGMCASTRELLVHGYRPGMEAPGVLHRYTLDGEYKSSTWKPANIHPNETMNIRGWEGHAICNSAATRMVFAPYYGDAVSFFGIKQEELYAVVHFDNLDYKQLEEADNGGARYTDVPHSWRNMSLANFMDARVVLNVVQTFQRGTAPPPLAGHHKIALDWKGTEATWWGHNTGYLLGSSAALSARVDYGNLGGRVTLVRRSHSERTTS